MCIHVPRAPQPAETPELMERLHAVQSAFKGEKAGGGRKGLASRLPGTRLRKRRKPLEGQEARERRKPQSRRRPRRAMRGREPSRLRWAAAKGKFVPACLACADVAILVCVLCALYAPGSLPAQALSWFAAGR
jgi:hypothetical protein